MQVRPGGLWLAVVAGIFCLTAGLAAGKPARETPRAIRPKPGELEAIQRLQDLRKERIRGNEKVNASEYAGVWKLRLPAGFEYTVQLKQTEEGLLRLTCAGHALVLLGDFACQENELRLVRTHHSAVDDYIWTYHNGKFVLTTDDQGHGSTYLLATMTRVP